MANYKKGMPMILQKFAKDTTKICPRNAQSRLMIYPKYVKDISIYAQYMPKICLRYIKLHLTM